MAKISIIEPLVKKALLDNELTREDNFVLYVEVLKNYVNVDKVTFEELCLNHVQLGVPSLETITRCRRKLQAENPDLIPDSVKEIRAEEEAEHYAYSKS